MDSSENTARDNEGESNSPVQSVAGCLRHECREDYVAIFVTTRSLVVIFGSPLVSCHEQLVATRASLI